jgi:hypothetical protein
LGHGLEPGVPGEVSDAVQQALLLHGPDVAMRRLHSGVTEQALQCLAISVIRSSSWVATTFKGTQNPSCATCSRCAWIIRRGSAQGRFLNARPGDASEHEGGRWQDLLRNEVQQALGERCASGTAAR